MIRLFFGIFVYAVVLAPVTAVGQSDDLTAKEIVDKVLEEDSMGISEGQAYVKLVVEDKKGNERVRKIVTRSVKVDGLRWSLVTFMEPDEVAGTKLLSKEQEGDSDLQYLYLSGFKEKRRIAGEAKNDSFMGTDFTYADMEQKGIKDAEYQRLPDEDHSEISCFRIDAVPSSESEYSKLEMWIDKKDFLPLKIYFYDKGGNLLKKFIARHVKEVDGRATIVHLLMKNVKKGSRTSMELLELERGKRFDESVFDENSLDK